MIFVLIYFLYFTIYGSNGFLTLIKLDKNLINIKTQYESLTQEKNFLQIKNNGLYIKTLDLDILEEESKKIGYINEDEFVLLINNE